MTRQGDLFGPVWPSWVAPYAEASADLGDHAFGIPFEAWADFEEWRHTAAGREVANLVIRYALQMKRRGWEHYGIEAIINRIRWEQALKHGPDGDGYKVNNNWKKRLAIWAMTRHDDLEGFFRLRDNSKERGNDNAE
jgi:hypothetical protein